MVEPEFIFTIPPVACLFGERENIARLYTSGWSSAIEFTLTSMFLAADAAARAIAGRPHSGWGLTVELGTPEHQAARASLHAYLLSSSPEVVVTALWGAVEKEQRRAYDEHDRTYNRDKTKPPKPHVPALLVLHLDSEAEFALIQQRAPRAIAVEVVGRQPASEATMPMPNWPSRCTRIGSQPDCPTWAAPESAVDAHQRSWAELARQRIAALAKASLEATPW